MESIDQYLPNEILKYIFDWLDPIDKAKTKQVSKLFGLLTSLSDGIQIKIIVKGVTCNQITHMKHCNFEYYKDTVLLRFIQIYRERYGYINSIIVHQQRIYVDTGSNISYLTDNRRSQSNTNLEGSPIIQLETNDQIYIECRDKNVKCFIDYKKLDMHCDYPAYITVSELHVIQICLDGTNLNCRRSYRSVKALSQLSGKNINNLLFPRSKYMKLVGCPIMAACDSNENIYILFRESIKKFDLLWQFIEDIKLEIDDPIWLSIYKDQLYICNRSTIYVCELNGLLIYKIDKIFKNLRCLAFSGDNIVVADGFDILKISL